MIGKIVALAGRRVRADLHLPSIVMPVSRVLCDPLGRRSTQ